jgi:NAD-dependent dihydropyrimidine dehydrogenase PreA subunit
MGLRYLEEIVTLKLDAARCDGCRMCTRVCLHEVFTIEDKRAVLADRDACMECGACALNCPEGAISVDAGVGCASGVINGLIRGTEPTCDCGDDASTTCC